MDPLLFIGAMVSILPGIFLIGKASHDSRRDFIFASASNWSCAAQKYLRAPGRKQYLRRQRCRQFDIFAKIAAL
jgi:hypothetical protein